MGNLDWVRGNLLGARFPAHAEALREGGARFLSGAFHAAGALGADNEVARITRLEDCPGGSTGRKLLLSVEYARPEPRLHADLFVKFSRDFADPIRDRGRDQMESEARFGLLSRSPGFPIAVPECYFAEYDLRSGTGILISQRIFFGRNGIEPHYDKCLDHKLPDPLAHYQALLRAVARLAGTHRAGGLSEAVARNFPLDPARAIAADRIRYDAAQLQRRAMRFAEFFAAYPQLIPENLQSTDFLARLREELPRFLQHEQAIKRFLYGNPDMIALCHWNANIDNAWFCRAPGGGLECGLMDWGRVSQMNVALAVWGSLSGADKVLWDEHLDPLLGLFVSEYRACGGPDIDAGELRFHLDLFVAMLGMGWLMDAPSMILREIPDLEKVPSRCDPRFERNESARSQLHMATIFLNLWQTHDFGKVLDLFLRRADRAGALDSPGQGRTGTLGLAPEAR